jgi:hypothetical protein
MFDVNGKRRRRPICILLGRTHVGFKRSNQYPLASSSENISGQKTSSVPVQSSCVAWVLLPSVCSACCQMRPPPACKCLNKMHVGNIRPEHPRGLLLDHTCGRASTPNTIVTPNSNARCNILLKNEHQKRASKTSIVRMLGAKPAPCKR